jgi:hypothetical protein
MSRPCWGAVSPDRKLNEPRKRWRKPAVELGGVDLLGDDIDDFSAAAWPVAADAVGVVRSEPVQDPGPVQEIVHERVDHDHAATDLVPPVPSAGRAEKQARPRHQHHFVGNAVDLFQRLNQSSSHSGLPVGLVLVRDGGQPPVDPTDEITASKTRCRKRACAPWSAAKSRAAL